MNPLTGLRTGTSHSPYDVSRYYDPVAGVFLSADVKQGNAQGMNPYAYVVQNPETLTDPSGQMYGCPGCGNSGGDGGDPLPPPPPTQPQQPPSAPGHGMCYGSPSQCQSDPQPHKQHDPSVNLNGCDPNTNLSEACHAWAYDATQVQKKRLDYLNWLANLEIAGSALLLVIGDILVLTGMESPFEKADALIQLIADSLSLLVDTAAVFGGGFSAGISSFLHVATAALAGVKLALAAASSHYWWIADPATLALNGMLDAVAGPADLMLQGVEWLAMPVLGYLLGAGSYALQSMAYANYAEAQRESDMSLQDWCAQYGGCPSYSSYH